MDEAVTVRPKGRQEVSAIEELEKLVLRDMDAWQLTEKLIALLFRLRSEVRERERAAFVAGAVWGQERANGIHPGSAYAEALRCFPGVD